MGATQDLFIRHGLTNSDWLTMKGMSVKQLLSAIAFLRSNDTACISSRKAEAPNAELDKVVEKMEFMNIVKSGRVARTRLWQ
jgi:hypothetical protein